MEIKRNRACGGKKSILSTLFRIAECLVIIFSEIPSLSLLTFIFFCNSNTPESTLYFKN